jgi:hypothetical protein
MLLLAAVTLVVEFTTCVCTTAPAYPILIPVAELAAKLVELIVPAENPSVPMPDIVPALPSITTAIRFYPLIH